MSGDPACCPPGSEPFLAQPEDYKYAGTTESVSGVETYVTGSAESKAAVIMVADVWGMNTGLHKVVADSLARQAGLLVVGPDLFHGDPPFVESRTFEEQQAEGFGHVFTKFLFDQVSPDIADKIIPWLKNTHKISKIGLLGFCYGGYVVAKFLPTGLIDAGASAHPAVGAIMGGTKEDPESFFAKSKCPVLFLNAGNDPELQAPGGVLHKALESAGFGEKSVFEAFPDMLHGWTVRGEATENTKRDRKRAMELFVSFFSSTLKN
eukprot:TRINITY_DN9686_c0_g1_i4.p2 TRINITY_DN9686_c0_g1~~TRINITY_DN9686_c0_g1_i4.p2  ORF type:complete len:264 (-),score=73.69 TRINITY_DN9686_c0_g1_i4:84-875(-)